MYLLLTKSNELLQTFVRNDRKIMSYKSETTLREQIFAEQIFAVGWVKMDKFRGTYFCGKRIFTKFAELIFAVSMS